MAVALLVLALVDYVVMAAPRSDRAQLPLRAMRVALLSALLAGCAEPVVIAADTGDVAPRDCVAVPFWGPDDVRDCTHTPAARGVVERSVDQTAYLVAHSAQQWLAASVVRKHRKPSA